MLIALDYDNTYTHDPVMWNTFIKNAIARNHKVICVTMRKSIEGDEVRESIGKLCRVIFTERRAKAAYLLDFAIRPDVWIDDSPLWIYKDG